ncbi:substrate-binding domain-containing protein [Streptomyces sp. NBC_00386]|uniref:substrate-binding domain-containing protein n=1 Tax=Streptomyces sp. NBC_00386 TaxID=2975734 RepID=UPI003FCC7638
MARGAAAPAALLPPFGGLVLQASFGTPPRRAGAAVPLRLDAAARSGEAMCATSSDLRAFGGYTALCERGLRVPHDISVVGFDDVPIARWSDPTPSPPGVSAFRPRPPGHCCV